MKLGSGAFEGPFTFKSRFEEEAGTNPEVMIGAALAGCFSMFLCAVPKFELDTLADIPGIDNAPFPEKTQAAKTGCPVSRSLAGTDIVLTARLKS